jgi:Flp pilus assembly protein CpaB
VQENKTNRVVLLVAVVLGVLAMVLAFVYMNQQDASRIPPMKIVVAARDLSPTKPVDPSVDFRVLEVPMIPAFKAMGNAGLSVDTRFNVKGQRLNQVVLKDTPIFLAYFSSASDLELHPGYTGLSVQARGANGLSGLLVPGDEVKVIVTKPSTRMGANTGVTMQWESALIVPRPLRVLAVGSKLARARQQFSVADQYENNRDAENTQNVTLEVTEAEARQILEQSGDYQLPITLLLTGPANQSGSGSMGMATTAPGK